MDSLRNLSIVFIEQDISERNVIRELVETFIGEEFKNNLQFFTSEDEWEGLDKILNSKPDLVIINSDSASKEGKNVMDFIKFNNGFLSKVTSIPIVITYDKKLPKDIPDSFLLIDKNEKDYRKKLIKFIQTNLIQLQNFYASSYGEKFINSSNNKPNGFRNTLTLFAAESFLLFYDKALYYQAKIKKSSFKLFYFLLWLIFLCLETINYHLLNFLNPKSLNDSNKSQLKKDQRIFFIRQYPSVVSFISLFLFLIILGLVFIIGGVLTSSATKASNYDCLLGGDHAGLDWNPATDCAGGLIAGIHTNIGIFNVLNGETVSIKAYDGVNYGTTQITAATSNIAGTLSSDASGYLSNQTSTPTNSGPGGTQCGPDARGGAGHGGRGGSGLYGSTGGNPYGSMIAPITMGSGGGSDGCTSGGGKGGGAIKLTTTGTLTISGRISSKGGNATMNRSGAGAGGSIYLISQNLAGSGVISSDGGNYIDYGGGGGGGRVAVYYSNSNTFNGTLSANSGNGQFTDQQNGTVILVDSGNNDLYIKNTQFWNADPTIEGQTFNYRNITVTNNSTLYLNGYYTNNSDGVGFIFNVTNFNIDSGSTISGDGRGFKGNIVSRKGDGPGGGGNICPVADSGGGGSYGGIGGFALYNDPPGTPYGSAFTPINLGSAGGANGGGCASMTAGGAGGSAVKLNSTGIITINGSLSMNGGISTGRYGGGSGGSIYIITNSLVGSGAILANGSNGGDGYGGGGGGGRIAINYVSNSFSGVISSNGGSGYTNGKNGTLIYLDTVNNNLLIKSSQTWFSNPEIDGGNFVFNNLTIQNNANLNLVGSNTTNSNGTGFTFIIQNNLTINTGSSLNADSGGYLGGNTTNSNSNGSGPGGGIGITNCSSSGDFNGGGGSYGGIGGNSTNSAYGSQTQPIDLGSGGGGGKTGSICANGTKGGGAIKLLVSNILTTDGQISANGENNSSINGGAGSGGSVYIIAKTINGSSNATIFAKGGNAQSPYSGGNGGGGRVAIYYTNQNNWNGSSLTPSVATPSGSGGNGGTIGTVFIGQAQIPSITSLAQYKPDCSTQISQAGSTSQSTVCIKGILNSSNNPDNLKIEVELRALGDSFTNTATHSSISTPFIGSPIPVSVNLTGIVIGTSYHWQYRVIDENNISTAWTSFGTNNESEADFSGQYPSVQFTSNSSSANESLQSPAIQVSLSDTYNSNVSIDYQISGGTATQGIDYTLTNGTLTFLANTSLVSLPITIINNNIQEPNKTISITLLNPTNSVLGSNVVYTYTINNDDFANISKTVNNNQVIEGGLGDTLNIAISTQPTSNVTVTIQPNAQLDFASTDIIFTPQNWSTTQHILFYAIDDFSDNGNRSTTISFSVASADPYYNNFGLNSFNETIIDNDTLGVIISSAGGLNITEGSSNSFTVKLNSQPSADVVINLTPANGLNLNSNTLTFTNSNWNTNQTISVSYTRDYSYTGNISKNIAFASTSSDPNYEAYSIPNLAITIIDIDTPGVNQSTTNITVYEAGITATIYYSLKSIPTANVTINFGSDPIITKSVNSITFTPQNWNINQSLTIIPTDDALIQGNRTTSITRSITSTDTNYSGLTLSNIGITLVDNDIPVINLNQSSGSTIVSESGTTDTISFTLSTIPTDPIIITLNPDAQLNLSSNTVNLDSSNWNIPQIITISSPHDFIARGTRSKEITFDITTSDSNYSAVTVSPLSVIINDIDIIGLVITESSGSTNITEGSITDSYQVQLSSKPTNNVTINITNNAQLVITPNYAIFTPINWNTPQTLTVQAIDDLFAQGNRTTQLQQTTSSSDLQYNNIVITPINVSITDNDTSSFAITKSSPILSVSENGTTATINIKLTSKPVGDVNVTASPSPSNILVSQNSLTFDVNNWNINQVITVSVINDSVASGNRSSIITLASSSSDLSYNNYVFQPINVSITDDDNVGINVVPQSNPILISESGISGGTITFSLSSQPANDVLITFTNNPQLNLSSQTITFTNLNWNDPQIVLVTAIHDNIAQGTRNTNLNFTTSSIDTSYNNLSTNQIPFTINDIDVAGFNLSSSSNSLTALEGGIGSSYTISLKSKPTSNVVISFNSNSQLTFSPSSITFTSDNWNVAQTINVNAINDLIIEDKHTGTIIHNSSTTDTAYSGIKPNNLVVQITDNDLLSTNGGVITTPKPLITPTQSSINPSVTVTPTNPVEIIPTPESELVRFQIIDSNNQPIAGIKVKIPDLQGEAITDENGFIQIKNDKVKIDSNTKIIITYDGIDYENTIEVAKTNTIQINITQPAKPFSGQIDENFSKVQQAINKYLETETGYIGAATIIMTGAGIIFTFSYLFGSLITAGFLLQLLTGIFLFYSKNSAKTIIAIEQTPLPFVKILIKDDTDKIISKKLSNIDGLFKVQLEKGNYKIELIKDKFETKYLSLEIEKTSYLKITTSLEKEDQFDIATQIQLNTFDPRITFIAIASLSIVLSFVNLYFVKTITSFLIVGITIFGLFFIIRLIPKRVVKKS